MLYLVLVLVITAFVLLIAALTTANTLWAWVSVGISAVAAGLLVFDWLRSRRRVAAASAPRKVEPEPDGEVAEPMPSPVVDAATHIPPPERIEDTPSPVADAPTAISEPVEVAEPGEEPTDATDLLVITDLSVEVRVVDEHPRYHLAQCTWLSGKPTIPIAVSEARQLGFTPCARCGPDAVLAAKHRAAGKGAKQ